jgi:hypothetical protein
MNMQEVGQSAWIHCNRFTRLIGGVPEQLSNRRATVSELRDC